MISARRVLHVSLALLLLLAGGPTLAQETGTRDPLALARRLGGLTGEVPLSPLTPRYQAGERESFFVSRPDASEPQRIQATLVAASDALYLWVEEGLNYDAQGLGEMAGELERILLTQRLRAIHGDPTLLPGFGPVAEPHSLLSLPDVDDDPHLFLLYANGTGIEAAGLPQADLLPVTLVPGGFSNQRELLLLDATALGNEPLHSPAWFTLISAAHFEFLSQTHAPQQSLWLRRALANYVPVRLMSLQSVLDNAPEYYLEAPDLPLTQVAGPATPGVGSAQQLFLDYLLLRFGFDLFRYLFLQPEPGMRALDNALAAINHVDALTGRPATGLDIFADFVVASASYVLPAEPFMDGRYTLLEEALTEERLPAGISIENQLDAGLRDVPLRQFGTRYFYVFNEQPASFRLLFHGGAESALLPLPQSDDLANRFYWSGNGSNRDHVLTRRIDLSEVARATLHFDSWHLLADQRSYVYVAVSADDGDSWQLLDGEHARGGNRHGLAYGPGMTGVSNESPPEPYPFMGIMLGGEEQTLITEVTPGGPASDSALRLGDLIIGEGGNDWAQGDGIFPLLERHAPGDTIDLTIQRDAERLVIPVTLGAHTERLRPRPPLWLQHELDLGDHAGQEILLRFEYVSPPDVADQGLALDNIRIPEIGFHDDAQAEAGWTLLGWQRRDNFVPQRFLLQYISGGHSAGPPRVRRLIGPEDTALSGDWSFRIAPDEAVVFAVSAISEETQQPAFFDFMLETLDEGV